MSNFYSNKISIIVPVYNVEKYLVQCIDSILMQSFLDFELILVDDGSTDTSGLICDEYARKDSRIRVFHKNNGGVSSARNIGLINAKGDWILFLDADDWLENNALSTIINNTNNEVSLIQFNVYVVNGSNRRLHNNGDGQRFFQSLDSYYRYSRPELWNYCFKYEIISKLNLRFNENLNYAEDQVFVYTYLNYSDIKVKYIPAALYNYRINNTSATQGYISPESICNNLQAIEILIHLWEKTTYKALYSKCIQSLFRYFLKIVSKQEYRNSEVDEIQLKVRTLVNENLYFFLHNIDCQEIIAYLSLRCFICLKRFKLSLHQ